MHRTKTLNIQGKFPFARGYDGFVPNGEGEFVLGATGRRGPARLHKTKDEEMNEKGFSCGALDAVVEWAGLGSPLESGPEL